MNKLPRFQVYNLSDALKEKILSKEDQEFYEDWPDAHYTNILIENLPNYTVRIVGMDGGEPEDQTLNRNWDWIVEELNKLAKEIDDFKNSSALLISK